MRHDHLKRELELLVLLTQNRQYTADEICSRVNISRRSLYYYLEFFREAGFKVHKDGRFYYYISRESPFFDRLFELIKFTDEEAVLMRQLIDNVETKTLRLNALKKKLERFYDFKILDDEQMQSRVAKIMTKLHEAIKMKRWVRIVNYSSNNSQTVADRLVEPYLFMDNNNNIRCYEMKSGKNKTFRLSRMEDVEILEDEWIHESEHRRLYTDLFQFSGESHYKVSMYLGQTSHNLLLEEYPSAAPCIVQTDENRWLFRADVCSYIGIGRFVLGLYDDIEVIGDDGFKKYLADKIKNYSNKHTNN